MFIGAPLWFVSPLSFYSSSSCLSPSSSSTWSCSLSSTTRRAWQTCAAPLQKRVRTPWTSSSLPHSVPQDCWNWTALSGTAKDLEESATCCSRPFRKIHWFLWWTSGAKRWPHVGKFWAGLTMTPPCLPCVHSKRLRVCLHHAHMLKSMCACCRNTRGRLKFSHGGLQRATSHRAQHTPTHTTQHRITHNITRRKRERETEKGSEKTREEIKSADKRQDEKEERRNYDTENEKCLRTSKSARRTRPKCFDKNHRRAIYSSIFSESSESDRVFIYLHDLNWILRHGEKNQNGFGSEQ